MTPDQVNVLDIGLMLLACGTAFIVPFELFLGAYAILGPLHCLVLFALSWLHMLLELPLDHRTFVGIGHELGALVAPAPTARRPSGSRI